MTRTTSAASAPSAAYGFTPYTAQPLPGQLLHVVVQIAGKPAVAFVATPTVAGS